MIDLYGMSSPNVRKVVILLEELDIRYRLIHVKVFREAQFDPEFLALNPLSKVPVLVDHDRQGDAGPIFESGAILIYLAETYERFMPKAGADRYEVIQWLMAQMAQIGPMFGQHNHFLSMPSEASSYAAARYREQARRLYEALDRRLRDVEWLAGNAYSIADIATFPWAAYCDRHGFSWSDFPSLERWYRRISSRDAVSCADEALLTIAEADKEMRRTATSQQLDRFYARR
jgi:GSH-dependent disulfide-bond oxidoreductase